MEPDGSLYLFNRCQYQELIYRYQIIPISTNDLGDIANRKKGPPHYSKYEEYTEAVLSNGGHSYCAV